VLDDNYGTRWALGASDRGGWLQVDLGAKKAIHRNELRFEYAWKPYLVALEASTDGKAWQVVEDHRGDGGVSGSPVIFVAPIAARFERLVFADSMTGDSVSVFEWLVF
jgi:hypothetical protein